MTTFNTQRWDPQIAEAEGRLLDILQRLGRQRIPELEVGDFIEDLQKEPKAEPREGKLELFEEETGVRLLLRILEQVVIRVFNKLANVTDSFEKTSLEKLRVGEENKCLEKEVKSLKSKLRANTAAKNELEKLKDENSKLKSLLAKHSKSPEAAESEISLKKRKKSPLFDADKLATTPELERSGSVIFKRKAAKTADQMDSPTSHLNDPSFVPETLEVTSSPGCKKSTKFRGNRSVPDTPEKEGLRPSDNIEECLTPEKLPGISRNRVAPTSPVITTSKRMKLVRRTEVLTENRTKLTKTEPVKSSKVKKSKPTITTEEKNVLKVAEDLSSLNSKERVHYIRLGKSLDSVHGVGWRRGISHPVWGV